ncbi:putative redox protein [Alkalispirochaeta americana]|uniref:Putative redox protein n=1 Tax=Alkalispirochaeta americana TaxID=159291 RepID=A0A1N6V7T4_9SPIO|nr:OsmC family protein [Alkalispirochaeta americana]SIQ73676.1 putative redox protein [Alkalispirochaeta americana]
MAAETKARWRGDMSFDIELQGHSFIVDADESVGGSDQGPRPKALLLSALAGCTGMDVVSILKKMKVPLERLEISVAGENSEEHPKVYQDVQLVYSFWGDNLDESKLEKAVELSQEKYCGVAATLKGVGKITHRIRCNP